jgi:hypothetical protein
MNGNELAPTAESGRAAPNADRLYRSLDKGPITTPLRPEAAVSSRSFVLRFVGPSTPTAQVSQERKLSHVRGIAPHHARARVQPGSDTVDIGIERISSLCPPSGPRSTPPARLDGALQSLSQSTSDLRQSRQA